MVTLLPGTHLPHNRHQFHICVILKWKESLKVAFRLDATYTWFLTYLVHFWVLGIHWFILLTYLSLLMQDHINPINAPFTMHSTSCWWHPPFTSGPSCNYLVSAFHVTNKCDSSDQEGSAYWQQHVIVCNCPFHVTNKCDKGDSTDQEGLAYWQHHVIVSSFIIGPCPPCRSVQHTYLSG